MAIENRTVTLTGVFAKEATTTIPDPPVSGTSYRDTSLTKSEVEAGWPYKEIVDSASFNQALFEYATLTSQIEKYGFLPWSSLTDYEEGSLCLGTNGTIYQAVQATGPSTTAYDPVNDSAGTYWKDFVGSSYVTLSTQQIITGTKTFSTVNGLQTQTPLILKESDGTVEGGQIEFESGDTEPNTGKKIYLDRYNGALRVWGVRSDNTTVQPFMADVQSDKITLSANAQINLNYQLMPKYASATPISSGYVATSNGYFEGVVDSSNNYSIVIDGVTLISRAYSNTQIGFPFSIPVGIGSTIAFSSVVNPLFIPCVGG